MATPLTRADFFGSLIDQIKGVVLNFVYKDTCKLAKLSACVAKDMTTTNNIYTFFTLFLVNTRDCFSKL